MFAILVLITGAFAEDYGTGNLPCANVDAPAPVVLVAKTRWPFRAITAQINERHERLAYQHIEECSRIAAASLDNQAVHNSAYRIANVAVQKGQPVVLDVENGRVVTADAAVAHELPASAFGGYGYGGGYYDSEPGSTIGRDMAFINSQFGVDVSNVRGMSGHGGGSSKAKKAADEKAKADAEAAAAKTAADANAAKVDAANKSMAPIEGS